MANFAELVLSANTTGLKKGTDSLDDLTKAGGRAEDAVGKVGDETKTAGDSAGAMAAQMRMATKALIALGVAAVGAVSVLGFRGAIREGEQLERNLLRTTGIINATGAAAGRTAKQLHQQARELALGTLASTEGIMRGQQALLTFRNIQGKVYDDAIKAALDMSAAVEGINFDSAIIQLGKALEDPIKGMSALARGGTTFTEVQEAMVKGMVVAGDVMGAQKFILAELAVQYGGTAAAEAQGLAGAQDTLNQRQQEWLLKLNATLGLTALATAANLAMANGVLFMTDHMNDLVGMIAAATGAVLIGYAPAIIAATVATGAWVVSLFTLRGALLASGIGALVVGAGMLIGKFLDLVTATGGFGSALKAVYGVGKTVFLAIGNTAWGLSEIMAGVASGIAGSFVAAFAQIGKAWDLVANGMAATWNAIADSGFGDTLGLGTIGASNLGGAIQGAADSLFDGAESSIRAGGARIKAAGKDVGDALNALILIITSASDGTGQFTDDTEAAAKAAAALAAALDGGGGSGGGTAGALKKAKGEADKLTEKMTDAEKAAKKLADELNGTLTNGVDGVAGAFSDWMVNGLRDFGSFTDAVINQFKQMLSTLISTALSNPIKIALGIGGISASPAVAGVTSGGGGGVTGILGKLFGGGGSGGSGLSSLIGGFGAEGLAGGTGLLGGIGNTLGGLFSGGLSGAGAAISTALSGVGGFGMALGSIVPVLGVVALAVSFFKKKVTELDAGLRISVDNLDISLESYSHIQTKRFWGLSKKRSTSYKSLDDEAAAPIIASILAIQNGVVDAGSALGIATSTFDGFSTQFNVSLKGLSDAEKTKAVEEALAKVADGMAGLIDGLDGFTRTGEGASEALTRLSTSLSAANDGMDILNHTLFDVGLTGADAASHLVDLFGGIEAMTSTIGTYWAAFYTEQERTETTLRRLTEQFVSLGVAMPQSRAGFRELVEAIDTTTEAGRIMYAGLLQLSGAMDEVLPQVAQFTAAMMGLLSQIGGEIGSLIDVARNNASVSLQAANLWYKTATTLRSFLSDLLNTDLTAASRAQTAAVNQSRYNAAFVSARGGDIDAARDIPGLAKAYLQSAQDSASTSLEYRRIAAKVQDQVRFLSGIAELEGANKDVLHALYEQQITVLTNLGLFLELQGLTDAEVAKLGDGIQDMITDWDGTTKAFEKSLTGLEKAILEADAFSYDDLVGKLDVFVTMGASGPAWLKDAITQSADGIQVALDFIVRSELSAADKWLAVNGLSEHIKTIDFILGTDINPETRLIALAAGSELLRNLRFIVTKDIDAETRTIALAGNSELTRTINAILNTKGSDDEALQLALSNIGAYAVAVSASFAPNISTDVRRVVLTQSGGYSALVRASMSELTGEARRILLAQQGTYATNITAILSTAMNSQLRLMFLNANTSGVRAITIATAFPDSVSDAHRALLLQSGTHALRTIDMTLNTFGLAPLDILMLGQLSAGSGTVARNVFSNFTANFNRVEALGVLNQLSKGTGSINRIINGYVNTGSLSADQRALLAAITGSTAGTITLGGSFTFDPSTAFTDATNKLIRPMDLLYSMLDSLRATVLADTMFRQQQAANVAALLRVQKAGEDFSAVFDQRKAVASGAVSDFNSMMRASGVSMTGSDYSTDADGRIVAGTGYFKASSSSNFYNLMDKLVAAGATRGGTLADTLKSYLHDKYPNIDGGEARLEKLREQVRLLGGVPTFAGGGWTGSGARSGGLDGQGGFAAMLHPQETVVDHYRAPQSVTPTRSMFDTSKLEAELRAMRRELAAFKDQSRQLDMQAANNTRRSADTLRKWDKIGAPVRNPNDGTSLQVEVT